MTKSRKVVLCLLVVGLILTYFAPSAEPVVEPTKPARAQQSPAAGANASSSSAPVAVLAIRPRAFDAEMPVMFGLPKPIEAPPEALAPSPRPVKLAAKKEEPLEPPQAPPVPFKAFGRYLDGGIAAVFLQHNDRNLVAHVGDRIDGQYEVERIEDRVITLVYLPLNQRQTLIITPAP